MVGLGLLLVGFKSLSGGEKPVAKRSSKSFNCLGSVSTGLYFEEVR